MTVTENPEIWSDSLFLLFYHVLLLVYNVLLLCYYFYYFLLRFHTFSHVFMRFELFFVFLKVREG